MPAPAGAGCRVGRGRVGIVVSKDDLEGICECAAAGAYERASVVVCDVGSAALATGHRDGDVHRHVVAGPRKYCSSVFSSAKGPL